MTTQHPVHLLYIEDNPDTAFFITSKLEQLGAKVTHVPSISKSKPFTNLVDAIIISPNIQIGDSISGLDYLKYNGNHDVPVIAVSCNEAGLQEAERRGAIAGLNRRDPCLASKIVQLAEAHCSQGQSIAV